MKGRIRSNAPKITTIQMLQRVVFHASRSEIMGEASRKRSEGAIPAQKSITKRMPAKTIALPRSGCLSTSRAGRRAMPMGGKSPRSVVGGSRRAESQRASIKIVASLASSTGCPTRLPAMVSQLLVAAPVPSPPEPKPTIVSTRRKRPKP